MARTRPQLFRTGFATYTKSDILGEGGSGRVYKATDDAGTSVALKVLDPDKATREKRKRFKNEILFGLANRHPCVLRIIDYGAVDINGSETLFYVMPLYQSTLRGLMRLHREGTETLRLFGTLLDGVEAAHLVGVVHRDLKPENVLFDENENALVVADFGIADFEQEELYTLVETRPGARLANFIYAAPEQKARGNPVGRAADIYALGLILHELFTGEVPQGTGYRPIAAVAPAFAYLDNLVAEMIRQQPHERPASIDEVKQRLISHRNEFIGRQKLSELSNTVVPEAQVDDPLVADPIRVVGLDAQPGGGVTLRLNREPNQDWIALYRRTSGHGFFMDNDFRQFAFHGPTVHIEGSDHMYQQLINQVKAGLESTNVEYAALARQRVEERVQSERRRLEAAAQAERRRLDLLERLHI